MLLAIGRVRADNGSAGGGACYAGYAWLSFMLGRSFAMLRSDLCEVVEANLSVRRH